MIVFANFAFMPEETPLFSTNKSQSTVSNNDRRREDKWKIMLVDDEQGIHDVTVLALKKFKFQDKGVEFLHAYNGNEACQLIQQHPDTALILLDVVMETDDAGLKAARFIREQLNNKFVRIVLRTGQPGSAPETQVIQDYDINDYKDKTELTVQKLNTVMFASLRSYRDIMAIEQNRTGLERVINSTSDLFKTYELDQFVSGLLLQIASVMNLNKDALYAGSSSFLAGCEKTTDNSNPTIITGTGRFKDFGHKKIHQVLRDDDIALIQSAIKHKRTLSEKGQCVFYFENNQGSYGVIFLSGCLRIDPLNQRLMELFSTNISIAYDNVSLYNEIEDTQHEVILTLGTIAEFRSRETSAHVNRVARYSELLARKYGMDSTKTKLIHLASPMHDIGKIGIPDSILHKPGKLTDEEFEVMKSHCQIGYDMLKKSSRPILKTAATIALEHQEKWDGSGYPDGKSAEGIHIYGRITAVADVFDALGSDRCYKKAWPLDKIIQYFKDQRGKHFDPNLTDILLNNLDDFLEIRDLHPSTYQENPLN